ncbi:amidohydrolase [Staphylococcus simiae]|uniref:M20/M25/M40 family peptidase n=1 Tax=Staphylococcus simiae CCM 7213 = CCUG 51256 TaxID=911238 RepID=G5JKB6_9STAP|nr:amidohydrolase [Staphylococcus simiae]EHJ07370.1 M20/M25/M40 family peptidase [Staphylococcus simiae CCM 7213 = CCUG 51256]PNZ14041.1 amidohydrolase [Staphylococcus simiae]
MTDYNQLVAWRRYFHQHPELSNEEINTTAKLQQILEEHDINILETPLKTGLVAEIGQGDQCIAIRSDIDALPINELVNHDFKSVKSDVMHACGHDIHMASVLGTALQLKAIEGQLNGRVKIIFQAAEELGYGALEVVNTGIVDDVSAILGFHNYPSLNVGEFAIKSGVITSAVDRFEFNIQGVGGHAAKPEQSNDPVIVLGQLINSIQSIVSRNISAFDEAVVTIGQVTSGSTWNVIADQAYVQGTVRTFDANVRDLIEQRLQDIAQGLTAMFNATVTLNYTKLPGAVINDQQLTDKAIQVAQEVGYNVNVMEEPLTIGEDFSGFSQQIPGVFAFIGSNSNYDLHHPQYDPDEMILKKVPSYFVNLVKQLLV